MSSNPSPPKGGPEDPPFFAPNASIYRYRVTYKYRDRQLTLIYNNVQEVILNLHAFVDSDQITYITREDGEDFITRTVDQFKFTVASSIHEASQLNIEAAYYRLVLTNHYSPHITDKGRLKSYDYSLRKFVCSSRGGVDWHLALEQGHTKMYLKLRRQSLLFLVSFTVNASFLHDISFFHINIPRKLFDHHQGLLQEALNMFLGKTNHRLYSYDPIEGADNDVMIPTDFSAEITAVINLLIQ